MRHEMAVRLRHCCCGCSLKEGTIVIGVICIVSEMNHQQRSTQSREADTSARKCYLSALRCLNIQKNIKNK
jgi:hypothetical protein